MILGNSSVTTLPASISKLQALEVLDFSENGMTVVPEEVFKLKKLKSLLVLGNKIEVVSDKYFGDPSGIQGTGGTRYITF